MSGAAVRGDSPDTRIWYAPISIAYLFDELGLTPTPDDRFELKLIVPFVSIDGPGDVVPGGDGSPVVRSGRSETETHSGLGDVVLRATWLYLPDAENPLPAVEIGGKLKIPTADEDRSLGTGEPSYSLQLDVYESFGRVTPLATVGYRFVEQSPNFELRNTLFASGGFDLRAHERLNLGLVYDWREASSSGSSDAHELFPYAMWKLRRDLRLGPYAVVGLSNGSPDYGIGFQLRIHLAVR